MSGKETMQLPVDTRLAEELAEDDVVEMANLTTAQTGVPGTIFISTAMGGHRPRVKYFGMIRFWTFLASSGGIFPMAIIEL